MDEWTIISENMWNEVNKLESKVEKCRDMLVDNQIITKHIKPLASLFVNNLINVSVNKTTMKLETEREVKDKIEMEKMEKEIREREEVEKEMSNTSQYDCLILSNY